MSKPLTLVAPLNQLNRILFHGRPIISLSEYFLGHTPFSRMVPINPLVDFPQYVVSFVWSETSQVGHGVATSIKLLIEYRVSVSLILYSSCLVFVLRDNSISQVF